MKLRFLGKRVSVEGVLGSMESQTSPRAPSIYEVGSGSSAALDQLITSKEWSCDWQQTPGLLKFLGHSIRSNPELLPQIRDHQLTLTKKVLRSDIRSSKIPVLVCSDFSWQAFWPESNRTLAFVDHSFSETVELLFELLHLGGLAVSDDQLKEGKIPDLSTSAKLNLLEKCLTTEKKNLDSPLEAALEVYRQTAMRDLTSLTRPLESFYYTATLESHFRNFFYRKMVPSKRLRSEFIHEMTPAQQQWFARSIFQIWFSLLTYLTGRQGQEIFADPELASYLTLLSSLGSLDSPVIQDDSAVHSIEKIEEVSVAEFLRRPEKYVFKRMFIA